LRFNFGSGSESKVWIPAGNEKAGRLLPAFSFQNKQIEVMIEIPAAAVMVERRREN
jgi:hypothetical protein